MRTPERDSLFSGFIALSTLVLVVAVLRFAQNIMVPIAIAILLAFLLSPMVERLIRWGLGKIISVVVTAALAFLVIGCVGWIVSSQAWSLIGELPKYEANINAKIDRLKAPHRSATLTRMADMIQRSEKELSAPVKPEKRPDGREPVPVRVEPVQKTPVAAMTEIAAPILGPLGSAGIVLVLVIAILMGGDDLRDRVVRTVSPRRMSMAHLALDDAAQRVFRYLAMQFMVNAGYGVIISLGLIWIGIPGALLWGLLAMLLRFIPFLGPWIAAGFPVILAVALDPGWMKAVYTFALYAALEAVTANIVEVFVYGASTGVSALSLLFAAFFWTWLWGPAGLFLSTPLTVWLMVIGKYVPALKFLRIFLESSPAPETRRSTGRHSASAHTPAGRRSEPLSGGRADTPPNS